jgi:hypothetical protein
VEQSEIGLLFRQHRKEIGKRRQDRETDAPPVTVMRAEQRHLADNFCSRDIRRELTMHGLGDDKTKVVVEAIRKPLTPVRRGIGMTRCGLYPYIAIAQFNREGRYVVCPKIKGTATFQIEAGVVPVTGQDAVLDTTALKRKSHVRAPIVEGKRAPIVVDHKDWTVGAV